MDILDKIKEDVPITDIAKDIGFTMQKKGNYYNLKEHDSLMINPSKNRWKQYSTGLFGTNIDFLSEFANMSIKDSIAYLKEYAKGYGIYEESSKGQDTNTYVKKPKAVKKEEALEKDDIGYKVSLKESLKEKNQEPDIHYKNAIAYLIKSRKVDKDIVMDFIKKKMLYQDIHKNCVFVSPSLDEPKFACKRGTNTKNKFQGDVKGCDYEHSFFVDNKGENLIICESVIDAMSRMTFEKKGFNLTKGDYLAIGGTCKGELACSYHLKNKEYKEIKISLDMDDKGLAASKKLYEYIKNELNYKGRLRIEKIKEKDWNEQLVSYENMQSIKNKEKENEVSLDKKESESDLS